MAVYTLDPEDVWQGFAVCGNLGLFFEGFKSKTGLETQANVTTDV